MASVSKQHNLELNKFEIRFTHGKNEFILNDQETFNKTAAMVSIKQVRFNVILKEEDEGFGQASDSDEEEETK